jgi:hypothetical protein
MRASQFIQETVTFGPAKEAECPACKGTGQEEWDEDTKRKCLYCNGTGKVKRTQSTAPELNVSNANARVVLKILGINEYDELTGHVPSSEFPALQKRLLRLKNIKDKRQQFEIPSTTTKRAEGPEMIDFGVSSEQVEHYIDSLMEIIKFAQDNKSNNIYLAWA